MHSVNDDVTHKLGMYREIIKNISKVIPIVTVALGNEKFLGLIKSPLNNKWIHLDIRLTLIDTLPYAWLYYTGGKIFNKLIRERLKKKGYKLNDYGIFKVDSSWPTGTSGDSGSTGIIDDIRLLDKFGIDKNGILKINEKQMMQYIIDVEKQIFKIADLEYKNVKERY